MPDIDASIPLRAGQGIKQPNYLDLAQGAANLAQTQQNLLTLRSQGAAGRDFQNAIGPDGTLNQLTLNRNLAADPEAARSAVAVSNAGQDQVTAALQRAGWTQEQGLKAFTVMGNEMGAVLASGKPVTQKDFQNVTAALVSHNVMPASDGAQLIAHAATMSPDQLDSTFRQYYAAAQHGAAALTAQVGMVDNGQQQIPVNTNPLASQPVGPMAGAIPVQNQLSPTTLAGQVPGVNALGQPTVNSLGNVLGMEHGAAPQTSPFPPAVLAQAGQIANQGGPGKNQAAGDAFLQSYASSHGISMQAPALAPGAPNGGVVTGLAPGVGEAVTSVAKQSADIYNNAVQQVSTIPQVRGALESLGSEIDTANPGPLNDVFTKVGGALSELNIIKGDQATASQLMQKSTMLTVMSQLNGISGASTDAKMTSLLHANPNGEMTTEASKAALGMIMGNLDYAQAEAQAIQSYVQKNGIQSAQQFKLDWIKNNPSTSVYQFKYLPEAERMKYMRSLSAPQQKKFVTQMEAAGALPTLNKGS